MTLVAALVFKQESFSLYWFKLKSSFIHATYTFFQSSVLSLLDIVCASCHLCPYLIIGECAHVQIAGDNLLLASRNVMIAVLFFPLVCIFFSNDPHQIRYSHAL